MTLGPDVSLAAAQQAADLGYQSFWTAETTGPEAFSLLAAVGALHPALDLGTGVLALQLRTPPLVAMAGATLQALHPERDIILGVGISSPVVTQQWHGAPYGDRPLARVREYVTLCSECLSGETVRSRATSTRSAASASASGWASGGPKVVIGALNPGMLQLAGELADGVLLNYLPGLARALVGRAGARPAPRAPRGRAPDDLRLRPRRRVRARGRHRPGPPRPVLLRRGRRLRPQLRAGRLRRRGRRRSAATTPTATVTGALAAVSDRMVDAIDHAVADRGQGAGAVAGRVALADGGDLVAEPGPLEVAGVGVDDRVGEEVAPGQVDAVVAPHTPAWT